MNFKTTSILLICLALVGGVIFFTRNQPAGTDATTSTDSKKLLTVSPADVQSINLTPTDGPAMVFKKSGVNDWQITSPVTAPADSSVVQSLLSDLTSLQTQGQVEMTEGTGLKTPRYVIALATTDGKTTTLNVGDKSGVGDRLYVQLAGNDKADVVPADISDTLEKPLDDFRDRKLIRAETSQVQSITLNRPAGELALTKNGAAWQITAPTTMPAETSEVTDLIISLTGLRANSFEQGDPSASQYGLGKTARSVTVTLAPPAGATSAPTSQPAPITLLVGRPDSVLEKNLYATVQGSGVIVTVPKDSFAFLDKKPLDLRDKKVLDIDPAGVNRIDVTGVQLATTQPTTLPAKTTMHAVVRRPATAPALTMGPTFAPAGPVPTPAISTQPAMPIPGAQPTTAAATMPGATMPSSLPTTVATSQPTSKPAPLSKWIDAQSGGSASDAQIADILSSLHPLRAGKYVDAAPTGTNTMTVKISSGGGGVLALQETTITIVDRDANQPPIATVNGLSFEVPQSFVEKFSGKFFEPGPAIAPPPSAPEGQDAMPNMPMPGGMP